MTPSASDRLGQARRHALLGQLLLGAAIPVAVGGVLWRLTSPGLAMMIAVIGFSLLAILAWRRTRAFDTRWLVRQLDARRADLDDSTDLLLTPPASLTPLQQLQQARVRERLRAQPAPDLRTPWPWARIVALWIAAAVVMATALLWPGRATGPGALQPSDEPVPTAPGIPHLVAQRLHVVPPAYTGLAARDEASLDTKAPAGSRLAWTLRFEPQPSTAALVFHDGQRIGLRRTGDTWQATHVLAKSTLYRVVAAGTEGQPPTKLRRLDAIPDRVPEVKVLAPDRGLSLVTVGQTRWPLAFEARDDYGIAPSATLKLTLAQGSGENIAFKEQVMTLRGTGPATARRFTASLDLKALGMAVGDDLIAQLTVQDTRSPAPQRAQSPGLILRWPADLGQESTGLEGMVKKVMPAYFRSQRQIIIDAEALQKQKRSLAADTFVTRSDAIGVDQRILRLRYGQFLGEEAEGEPQPPPTNDAEEAHADGDGHDHAGESAQADDGHGHGEVTSATGASFGREADVLEAYGHTHDHAEAATLLDPETRATLKKALDQMWQSELHLRQGHPDQALPFAYKALEYIKQVQQATRIYLARVGPELPPIDETRRMGGDRTGIAPRALGPLARQQDDDAPAPARAWAALANDRVPADAADLDALQAWLRNNEARVPDALDLFAAIDEVRGDPDCAPCRQRLRSLLWSASAQPPAQVPRRGATDDVGRRYLDALRQEPAR
ncbi:hypothetical protein ASD77_06245 [Pseudoxanthomonas sp. Root65]|uniref:hypothetical protein n=1 Tax=Pseudoxanthomonas sp. Root65 TaxID=1736576 RepID=UPI0006F781BA|nr:hypothetical protein [Pseudoxanthomonas sp. Root65]KRA54219.1 hypothetical protein ASD77_06245 [Pseudoxanthomonas sp. Root65]